MYVSTVTEVSSKFFLGCAMLTLASSVALAQTVPAIRILKGENQVTAYGSAFASPLVVWVSNSATHRSMGGLRVNFSAQPGITLSSASALTNAKGLASVVATGSAACASSVQAEIEGFPGVAVSFDGLTVNKAPLIVLPADVHVSGGKLPSITDYTLQGFVNGDTEETAQITGSPVLTTTATDRSRHANYAIKGNRGSLSAPNYTFVAGFGTLAILRKSAQQSIAPAANVVPEQTQSDPTEEQEGVLIPPPAPVVTLSVRKAILKGTTPGPSDMSTSKATAIPAQTAIAASATSSAAKDRLIHAPIKEAILKGQPVAPAHAPDVPVRSAIAQPASPAPQASQPVVVPVRSAIAEKVVASAETPKAAQGAVHAIAMPENGETSASPAQSYKPSSVRKAFNPPAAQ